VSSWTDVVARLVNRIGTVANVGKVHDRMRLVADADAYDAIAKATIDGEDTFRLWMVHLDRMDSKWEAVNAGLVDWNRVAVTEGFLLLEDAAKTEHTATALAESIIRAIDGDIRTTKLNSTILSGGPTRLAANEPRIFGFVICHFVRLETPLMAIEQV